VGKTDPGRMEHLTVLTSGLASLGTGDRTMVAPSDVDQGARNDCFLMAAMASIAHQHPDPDAWLRSLVKANPDGSYTVVFRDGKNVTVNPTFGRGHAVSDDPNEMWPALIEKAYGQAYGDNRKAEQHALAQGGITGVAMEKLTGHPSQYIPPDKLTWDALAAYQAQGQAITVATYHDPTQGRDKRGVANNHPAYKSNLYGEKLNQWHMYYVDRIDPATGAVVVHNPDSRPRKDIAIPFAEFQHVFKMVHLNKVK
jgi:hypothetical protein